MYNLGFALTHFSGSTAGTDHKEEDHLVLAVSEQTDTEHDEADWLSSHASLSGNNGSRSSSIGKTSHHQRYNSSGKIALAPVLHSMSAKRMSFLTWPLLQGAQDDLHHTLPSAAHAADNQSLLLPNHGYPDSIDVDSAQHCKLWHSVSKMGAAIWQFLRSMGSTLKFWGQCCVSAAEPDNNI